MGEERDGFELRGTFYPWAQQMRLVDPVLVTEVTGMRYPAFVEAWGEEMARIRELPTGASLEIDSVMMNGLVAVAFWQQHPDWSRAKVVRFLERLSLEDLEVVGDDESEDETLPPTGGESGNASEPSSSDEPQGSSSLSPKTSNGSQESRSDPATPPSTGHPRSVTGSPA